MEQTWWCACDGRIDAVIVIKSTKKTVTVGKEGFLVATQRVHRIRGASGNYFPAWKDAHAFLMRQAEQRLHQARRDLQKAQDQFGNVKGLKMPQGATL